MKYAIAYKTLRGRRAGWVSQDDLLKMSKYRNVFADSEKEDRFLFESSKFAHAICRVMRKMNYCQYVVVKVKS